MIYQFNGFRPVIHKSSFVHPQAAVTGNVIIGKECYVGPGAALRGDWGQIILEDGCNVQENCTIHMFPGVTVILREGSHIGHGAIIHGCTLHDRILVGMGAIILNGVVVGEDSIVAAGTLLTEATRVPPRSLVMGSPGKVRRELTDEDVRSIRVYAERYVEYRLDYMDAVRAGSPR